MKRLIFAIVTAFLLTVTIVIAAPPYRQAEANSAAKILISKDGGTYGFEVLWEHKRLDLSVEAHVLKPEYRELFSSYGSASFLGYYRGIVWGE
ncbi:MAG: hypothetical protein ACOY9Y_05265 [Bacillota bacterium]